MAFGSSDDIQIKVTLDATEADKQARQLQSHVEDAFKGIKSAASSPITTLKDFGKEMSSAALKSASAGVSVEQFASSIAPLAGKIALVTAGVGALAIGFKQLLDIAGDGDIFNDIAAGFERNAEAAGVAADVIQGRLAAAFNDTASSATVMTAANKLFAANIKPEMFDDLAFAAKGYADSIGGDATQALDQLTKALETGNTRILEHFGNIQNGKLIIDEFTQAQYANAVAARGVGDTYDALKTSLTNVYQDFARAIDNSSALKLVTEALGDVLLVLAKAASGAAQGILYFANTIADYANDAINGFVGYLVFTSELLRDLKGGTLPDLGRAADVANKHVAALSGGLKSTGKTAVDFKGKLDGATKATKNFGKEIKDALEKSDVNINDSLGFESYVIPSTNRSLQEQIIKSLKQINPLDIRNSLLSVRAAFLDGITGTPQQIEEETKKRLGIFEDVYKKVQDTFNKTAGGPTPASQAKTAATGTIFGFDTGLESSVASSFESAISTGINAALAGLSGQEFNTDQLVVGLTTSIGAAIGAAYGSPEAGAAIGGLVGQIGLIIADSFDNETGGTKARKAADRYFADIFDANRISAVIDGQIKQINDLVFNPGGGGGINGLIGAGAGAAAGLVTGGAAAGIGSQFGKAPPDSFATGQFDDSLQAAAAKTQAAFAGVGAGFEQLLGVADDIGGQIAAVLYNNVGGGLNNLQILVEATGKSFEELGDAVFDSFLNGSISLGQLLVDLQGLQDIFTAGIPGAIGAVEEAVANLQLALSTDKPGRVLFDALKDIGAEAREVGKSMVDVANSIAAGLGLGADRVNALLEAMKIAGINSITDLVNASNAQLAALAGNIQQVTAGQAATNTPITDPNAGITPATNFTPASFSRASSASRSGGGGRSAGQSAAAKAAQELKQLQDQTYKLVTASSAYESIIDKVNNKLISRQKAGEQISKLYKDEFKALQTLQKAEDAYQAALAKGVKGKKLGELAAALDKAQKAADKLKEKLESAAKVDLTTLFKLTKDMNSLGLLSKVVGVNLEDLTSTLTQGFLQGKLTIDQVNEKLNATKDLLGQGIPGVIGGVDQAFTNLAKHGKAGGIFSIDDLKDIAAEFDELYAKAAGPARTADINRLRKNFDDANKALQDATNSGASVEQIDNLSKAFQGADRAYRDFLNSSSIASLEDLRAELLKTNSASQVQTFFTSLQDAGIKTVDELKNVSNETGVQILANLSKLGFQFEKTDSNTTSLLDELQKQNTVLTDNKDVLQQQLNLIDQLVNAGSKLAPGFEQPLTSIANDLSAAVINLSKFDNKQYKTDIILNVSTNPTDAQTQGILDATFGNGASTSSGTGGSGPGLTAKQQARLKFLQNKAKKGKLTAAERRQLATLQASA
jgi:hypothetical protein